MTIEQVLELLDSAIRSEEVFVEEEVRRRQFLRAGEVQARLRALAALREAIVLRLSLEGREQQGES